MTNNVVKAVRVLFAISIATLLPAAAHTQTATAEVAAGDRAYAALDASAALTHYERAVELDSLNHEALWRASRSAADLEPEARGTGARHQTLLRKAAAYARRAVAIRPNDAEVRFSLARALGVAARATGTRERIRYANDVREHALQCLRIAPRHSGCLHVLGAWNAEVMRLSGFERFIARRLLGGRTFGSASWAEAIRYMEAAVAADPSRIAHRNELAEIYVERGRTEDGRRQYQTAVDLPVRDYNDARFKTRARSELERLRGR